MGSRKQLVLASLVSLMMAVAFVIGVMPLHGALRASAASSGSGRIDMVDLLNAVLNLQTGEATEISVSFPAEGAEFKVPDTTAQVFVNFQASAVGDASRVAYAINPDLSGEELDEPLHLDVDLPGSVGVAYGFQPPYNAVLDVNSLLGPVSTALSAYAFANAALDVVDDTLLIYSVRSGPTNFSVTKIAQEDFDLDKNGLPAPLTTVIQPGQQWRASYLLLLYDTAGTFLDFGARNVAIANLNAPEPEKQPSGLGITVAPEPGVLVTSPTFEQLFAAGLMYEKEEGFLIATTLAEQPLLWTSALQLAISEVYGVDNSYGDSVAARAARATWAAGVEAIQPPDGRVGWTLPEGRPSPYVEISLLAVDTADGTGAYREVENLPDDYPVVLELQNLDVDGKMSVQLWSYLSWIQDVEPGLLDFYFTSAEAEAGINEWDFIDQQIPELGGTFIAELTSLSIFGAFESAMSISDIYPDSASTCAVPGEVNIVGTFGVDAGATIQELNDQFNVFFGDTEANIVSAAEVYGEGLVRFAVDAPRSDVPQTVDVSVVNALNEVDFALLEQAFKYFDIFTLELVQADGGTISATPVQDTYLAGDVVNLVATAAENYAFVNWEGDVDDVDDIEDVNDETTTLTFDRDQGEECEEGSLNVQITAQFQYTAPITEYFLVVNVNPPGAGVVEQDPTGTVFAAEDPPVVVDLNAIPESGYEFVGWDGPVADPNLEQTTVTMTGTVQTIVVTANFEPTSYTLTVIVGQGGEVTVEPDRVPPEYFPGESATLTATPDIDYNFVRWEVNNVPAGTDPVLVLNFSDYIVRDITVTAIFSPNPVLTVLESEGGTVNVTSAPPPVRIIATEPDQLIEFAPETEVTLEAVADEPDFEFVQWEFDPLDFPENAQPDPFSPILTFTITGNVTVRAIFTSAIFEVADKAPITPDHAWLFGGVVANIRGIGFMPQSTQLLVYGAPVVPLEVTATDIWFVVPPLAAAPTSQSLEVDVTVRNPPFSQEYARTVNFRYDRYATSDDNITTTAFHYTGITVDTDVALGDDLSQASLILPPPQQNITEAYGLIRATKQVSLLEADQIAEGTAVNNAWNFAIHLYNLQVMDVGLNTGAAVHPEITNWTYLRAENTVPAQLGFTVADTTLTAAAIRNDVMMWSVDTLYDYGEDITTLVSPVNTDYQSTLEQLEVTPNVEPDSPADATPVTDVVTRLYDLTAFALRTGVQTLPAEFVDAMSISAPGGTVSGPTSGGTEFTVDASLGGLAWVTVGFAEDITATTPASATQLGTVIDNGLTEFSAVVQAPKWPTNQNTTVDVAIYLNSNLDEPLIIFENAFRYTQVGREKPPCDILLLLLGLFAALIGLAAGGDSGDGGGPCFIATAAYGTPMAADIDTLRALRDTYLLESSVGTAFVDAYYRVSPAIASVIAQSPALTAGVRLLLLPVIFAAKCLLAMPAVSLLTLGVAMMLARIRRRGKVKA